MCSKCGRVRTKHEDGMCATCRRIWTKPSMDAAVSEISEDQLREICEYHREGTAWGNIAKHMRQTYGRGPEGWGWHWAILVMAHGLWHDRGGGHEVQDRHPRRNRKASGRKR